ncbi:MAG: hypothetical protein ACI9T9_001362 [Oleiphilaceae bacterium]|jgi:hypothetical protein
MQYNQSYLVTRKKPHQSILLRFLACDLSLSSKITSQNTGLQFKKEFTMLVKELYKESVEAIQKDDIKTAKTTLLQILTDYPSSEEAVLARELLAGLEGGDSLLKDFSEESKEVLPEEAVPLESNRQAAPPSNYLAAKYAASLISYIGWLVCIVGTLLTISGVLGFDEGGVWFSMISGVKTVGSGLALVVAGQITRATLDNADQTRAILNHLNEKAS